MAAGRKNKNIEIHELIKVQTESGAENEEYKIKFRLKAEIKFNNNSITLLNNEIVQVDRLSFIVYKRDITYTDRIMYNNEYYLILSINPMYNNIEFEIIAEKVNQ